MAGQYTMLDPVGAIEGGQRMAMNTMQMQDMGQQMQKKTQMQTLRQQAVGAEGGYTPDAHKELLMNAGFFEEAQDIDDLMTNQQMNKQHVTEKALNLVDKTAQLVGQMGAPAWSIFRGSLVAAGLADEDSLPVEYDENAAQIAKNISAKANDTFRLLHFRDGDKQRDILNVGGQITEGKPYTPGNETAFIKNSKYFAETMGMSESEAADYMSKAKDKSDAAVYQDLLKVALRSTYGDEEEAARIAKSGLEAVREVRNEQRQTPPAGVQPPAGPVRRPGAEAKKYEVGKVYKDAGGNKAKYLGPDQWEPVQ
jgi:hypothetical protein